MGFDKLFANLRGKPVVAYSIAAFERTAEIGEIILVTREEKKGRIEEMIEQEGWRKVSGWWRGARSGIFPSGTACRR